MAYAQPTPECTEMAAAGQFVAQAPHSMQASLFAMRAFLFSMVKTKCGQTWVQSSHPMHFSGCKVSVVTSFKYTNPILFSS
jgi:hypothetical protein